LNIRKITTALALSVAVAVPAAYAESATATADAKRVATVNSWFERFDRDRNEKLTTEEFTLGRSYFAALDLDRDGILTRQEGLTALSKSGKTTDWKKMDTDGDGYVTVREWTGDAADFDAADTDGDRVLSRHDRDLRRAQHQAHSRLEKYDKNADGFVSESEFPADAAEFRKRDHNRDGRLNVDELMDDVGRKE
jgi:Ca2+-binding EF-hand superfamily protein